MPIDYEFTQKLINFGSKLAGDMVGQPFVVYRLNLASSSSVLSAGNIIDVNLRAKITHHRSMDQLENEILKANTFEMMASSDEVRLGDILVQNDLVYGSNSRYAVISRRPLKRPMLARVEADCTLSRMHTAQDETEYNAPTLDNELPYVLENGVFRIGAKTETATVLPCGITTIAQMKGMKPERFPLDTTTSWWYIYVPYLPGLQRLRENDIVTHNPGIPGEPLIRYRVTIPYISNEGSVGQFLLCEKATV